MKKIYGLIVAILLGGVNIFAQTFNYAEALQKSLYFYDANKSGNKVAGGRLTWRGNCFESDSAIALDTTMTNMSESFISTYSSILDPDGNGSVDLTGGFHDAGDHVKFGLPQSYSTSTIEWAFYEFPDAFINIGEEEHMREILRWGSDYYLKCTFRNDDGEVIAFCYQVGEGSIDHTVWAPPELIDTDELTRPAYFATEEEPASDQCAGAAASLALSYLNNKDYDSDYAEECLDVAIALYDFAVDNRGIGYDGGFYNSSYDADELSWAAIWLNIATGEEDYLNDIISTDDDGYYTGWLSKIINSNEDDWQNIWVHSWDTKWGGVFAKLAPITDDDFHWWIFRWNLEYWSGVEHEDSTDGNYLMQTDGGFSWLTTWGSARYNAAAQFQGMVYKKYADDRFDEWMTDQINYIMGDNPLGRSYIVGYSDDYAEHPHHRAAHGSPNNDMSNPEEHKHILYGALVGGPGSEDEHNDETSDYVYNEVAIDYNAGLVGALAGQVYYNGDGMEPIASFPPEDPELVEYKLEARIGQTSSESSQIGIQVTNESAFPPRKEVDIMVRYYFDITELYEHDQDINDISFAVHYDENAVNSDAVTATGPFVVNEDLGIYYYEFQWPESGFYGDREYLFAITATQDDTYTGRWDYSNDYSNTGLGEDYAETDYIVMYADGELVNGTPPSGNSAPSAVILASSTSGLLPLDVTFDASQSTDVDGDTLTYAWDFGDGSTATGVTAEYTFTEEENYTVTLIVSDSETSDTASVIIYAGQIIENDAPVASLVTDVTSGNIPLTVSFDASDSYDDNDDALTYTWDFGDGSTGSGETISYTYTEEGTYVAQVIVSDYESSDTATVSIEATVAQPTCDDAEEISIPYEFEAAGEYCWVTSDDIVSINSWNMSVVEVNGVDYTNLWSSELPDKINGNYYIYVLGETEWSHFEATNSKSTNSRSTQTVVYPNPFTTSVSLKIANPESVSSVKVLDQQGKTIEVFKKGNISSTMEIGESYSAGLYFILTTTDEGTNTVIISKEQ